MTMMSRAIACLSLTLLALTAIPAQTSDSNKAQARAALNSGVAAFKAASPREAVDLFTRALSNVDIALAMNPQYVDAMTYKNLLLREQAEITSDPQKRESLIQEANSWFQKALDARSRPQTASVRPGAVGTGGVGIGGPPPPGVGAIGEVVGGVPGGVRGGVPGGIIAATLAPPPPPPPPPPPTRIGPEVAQANLVSSVVPVYPPEALSARVQGVVLLQATINRQGAISDLRVISGDRLLQEAAIEAVRKWRYKPMLLNGEPIEVITTITVNFVLQ